MKLDDLTGKTFGRLTVLSRAPDYIGKNGAHKTMWRCRCECDNKEINVMATHLKTGHTTSCGCLPIEQLVKRRKKYNKYDLSGDYGIGWTTNTNEKFYFDLEDYDKIKDYAWMSHQVKENSFYIVSTSKHILLHRIIMDCPDVFVVDHKNHNTFDCRKANLRISTVSENIVNSTRCYQAGIKQTASGKYEARIAFNNKITCLGTFDQYEDALNARITAEKLLFKEYRYNNLEV